MSLVLTNCTKKYSGGVTAVDNVSIEVENGSFVGVIGPSGAGKSSMLRLINRLDEATSGRVNHDGIDVTALRGKTLREWRRRCAMIFQQFGLVRRYTVVDNVLLGRMFDHSLLASMLKIYDKQEIVTAIDVLDRLGIADLWHKRAEELSGGQQQRVAIARTLIQKPAILLADEPVASLDPASSRTVMNTLKKINEEDGITVFCNLHDLAIARDYCNHIIAMSNGSVVFDGEPKNLTRDVVAMVYQQKGDVAAKGDLSLRNEKIVEEFSE
ncbi:MAG: phosphonate ABC transporter ATP-binding protein [Pseudochelatococcus sp.]|jgi:phosphonate transport system ATP-binding protein|uniref:phosphonate ABC transporter ATP-binding protein n=1 Tax=Pseudochelatococcus sp. TaxID=2020869 RepID=UPI003D8F7375